MIVLAWKNISVRYEKAYMGITWAVLKSLMLMLIFTLVRSFVGIDSGDIPYPILAFAALMPCKKPRSKGVVRDGRLCQSVSARSRYQMDCLMLSEDLTQ